MRQNKRSESNRRWMRWFIAISWWAGCVNDTKPSFHTWATGFPRVWVWVRVGYPQLTIYPRQLKYSSFQLTIYPTTDFLKHLILSYSLIQNTCKNNRIQYILKQSVNQNVYARLYATEYFGCLGCIVGMDIWVFQFSRVNCQLWVSWPYPYLRKFSCSCIKGG